MTRLPDDIPFERWVEHVFDHPIVEPRWWHRHDDDSFEYWPEEKDPARTAAHMTQLFRNPAFLLETYSHAQIDQGLYYLVDPSCSSHMFALREVAVPWEDRRACIHAMCTLYSDLMAPLYGNDLGQAGKLPSDRPNSACYMWWDVIPLDGHSENPEKDLLSDAVLHVFRETLKLRSEACLESVLHGCGHWHMYRSKEIESIITQFLKRRRDISAFLRLYAELAAQGLVQ